MPDATRTLSVHSTRLIAAIELVKHAAATNPSRPVLNTIMVEGTEKGVRMVTADNYRIAIADVSEEASDFGRVLIWLQDVPLVLTVARATNKGMVELETDGHRLTVRTKTLSLSVNLCEGNFPRFEDAEQLDFGTERRTLLVGINPQYIGDALRALGKSTTNVGLYTGATVETPLLIKSDRYRELIMPVRLARVESAA